MPTFYLDDKPIEFEQGQDILTAALKAGEFIPHYCYHPAMSRVATCRMCMVEVTDAGNGRGMPKLQTSCSTPAADNMKVITKNDRVKRARESVMEFLLVNHPLDCPICDQAGECSLQDYSFQFGTGHSIVSHEKRIYGLRDIGSFLQLERNRCIHCTRCVRFTQEISKTNEMGVYGRTHQLTVDTFIDFPLSDKFQGNLADICPVGAITMKDFRFRKRVWHLKKTPSICTGCATGCNIWVNHHNGVVYRFTPRENQEVNKWWMCDEGRVSFHDFIDGEKRQLEVLESGVSKSWKSAMQSLAEKSTGLADLPGQVIVLASSSSTCEELHALKEFAQSFGEATLAARMQPKDAHEFDQTFDTFISEDKTPNQQGLKKLGFQLMSDEELAKLDFGGAKMLLVCGNDYDGVNGLAEGLNPSALSVMLPCLKSPHSDNFQFVFPSVSALEKSGHYINRSGLLQRAERAVPKALNTREEIEIIHAIGKAISIERDLPATMQESGYALADGDAFFARMARKQPVPKPKIPSLSY